jgi:ELP3 family radical SAM enzyme/protein acetyltransferase
MEIENTQRNKVITEFVKQLAKLEVNETNVNATLRLLSKRFKVMPSKRAIVAIYKELLASNSIRSNDFLETHFIQKAVRSHSGILNISVSLPPNEFSCKYNCHFCPNEPGMPRSYLSNEDVFKRALQVNFDTVEQVYIRLKALEANGHPIDKLEFRVLGGTFSSYDHPLADLFIRDLYYGANTFYTDRNRPKGTLEEEQVINVTSAVHVVGLGVETRPDSITPEEVIRFRKYGVTRVEMGVQHTDDALLRRVNRGHGIKQSKAAIQLLKEYGFKVEIHIMTDLPGATPEGDMECYKKVLQTDPDLVPDYLKDYPCLDVDFTKIKTWKQEGKWTPYAERTPDARDLKEVLIYRQQITPKWVRVNRMQRDFQNATEDRLGYTSNSIKSNLAQIVTDEAEKRGIYCQCIRCCELSNETFDTKDIRYTIHPFTASSANEFYICAEIPRANRDLLLGFIRLRICTTLHESILPELKGNTAMIRELHVYGRVKTVGSGEAGHGAQHRGIGKTLLRIAEQTAQRYGAEQMAVISGIGVRDYYKKQGYELRGTYMMKQLPFTLFQTTILIILALNFIICLFMLCNKKLNLL